MELNSEIIKVLANGGTSVVIFIIWFITYKTINKQYSEHVERLYKHIEEDVKYKELLVGILSRLESKLDIALSNIARKKYE